jgi:hypothetical protein
MAMTEGSRRPHGEFLHRKARKACFSNSTTDRHGRRHPFSSWVKRLANLKGSSSSEPHNAGGSSSKRADGNETTHKSKKNTLHAIKNNPYPLSGTNNPQRTSPRAEELSVSEASDRYYGLPHESPPGSSYDHHTPENCAKSTAPTLSTNGDTAFSETAYSKAGTMATGAGGFSPGGGEGSTFSSPAPSVRSLTTTLTTVQSAAPSTHIHGQASNSLNHGTMNTTVSSMQGSTSTSQQVQFSHQFPASSASAVPLHMAFVNQPNTYSAATANNLLTDNASLLTLASSSKRRRRNSLDTNASVRALAPSSIFGGSRESLPLSVLSGHIGGEPSNASAIGAAGVLSRSSIGGLASAERASVYSSSGVAPIVPTGDRNSLITSTKQLSGAGDTGSVRSGVYSHTRNDSATGSVGGPGPAVATFPSAAGPTGRISRRSSGWGQLNGSEGDDNASSHQIATEVEGVPALERPVGEELISKN